MNHTPLMNSKRAMILAALAAACPIAQGSTAGYITTSSAAGTSQVGPTAVYSGDAQDSINAREAARRKAKTNEAMELLQQGRTCYAQKQYIQALEKYEAAWKVVPKAPATQKLQEFLVESIGDASIATAMEYSRVGRYDEAEQLLLDVLERDPNNKRARNELSLLRDPVRNNPALTPEHVKNVDEVARLLTLAYGHIDLGNYDAAYNEFNRVIKIDPYNMAARRGQEAISKRRMKYYQAAYDSFRAKALSQVDALWEEQLPQVLPSMQSSASEAVVTSEGILRNRENLVNLKFDHVQWEGATIDEILDYLRSKAADNGMPMNFIFERAQQQQAAPMAADEDEEEGEEDEEEEDSEEEEDDSASAAPMPVVQNNSTDVIDKLELRDVTAADILRYICSKTGCEFRVEDKAVVVFQNGAGSGNLVRRQWTVRPSFFQQGGADEEAADDEDGDFVSSRRSNKIDAKAVLIEMGVNFPRNATAKYAPGIQTLTVVNTEEELESVEEAINQFRQTMPRMVKVSAKFVEISQTNEEELSFDWVVNPFGIGGIAGRGQTYVGGVGAASSEPMRFWDDFVNQATGGLNAANNAAWPIGKPISVERQSQTIQNVLGNGLASGGLRSGSGAITTGALENLIRSGSAGAATTTTVAPGIMSMSGIYDRGSYQAIMRGLSQKKGVDVMSAPSLVISGLDEMAFTPEPDPLSNYRDTEEGCAKIEVIRRFVYPTEYEPPQPPDINPGGGDNNTTVMPVAIPATPSAWGVEEVGVMLRFRIESLNEGEGDVIRFNRFEIRVVDFEGFVNYGSPILSALVGGAGDQELDPEDNNWLFENLSLDDFMTWADEKKDTFFSLLGVGSSGGDRPVQQVVLTENRIDMPIFSRRYINSNPCVYDGHTIAIGGMIQDEVQKVEDKIPVLGDLPFVGRLFRSEAESHVRKNLMVFVTADIIDPFGKPLRERDSGTTSAPAAGTVPGLFPDDALVTP